MKDSENMERKEIVHNDFKLNDPNEFTKEEFNKPEMLILSECMLCLTEISNCVLMNCGHSSICFSCTMKLAIKNRDSKKPIICHLCRKEIRYALKIDMST
jgi:hypothetical protein